MSAIQMTQAQWDAAEAQIDRLRERVATLETERSHKWKLREELEQALGVTGLDGEAALQSALAAIAQLRADNAELLEALKAITPDGCEHVYTDENGREHGQNCQDKHQDPPCDLCRAHRSMAKYKGGTL